MYLASSGISCCTYLFLQVALPVCVDVFLLYDGALGVYAHLVMNIKFINLLQDNLWINNHAGAYQKLRLRIHEGTGNHPQLVGYTIFDHGVTRIGAHSSPRTNRDIVSDSQVRHDLALSTVTEETIDNYAADHDKITLKPQSTTLVNIKAFPKPV